MVMGRFEVWSKWSKESKSNFMEVQDVVHSILGIYTLSIPILRSFVVWSLEGSRFGQMVQRIPNPTLGEVQGVVLSNFRNLGVVHSNFRELRGMVMGRFEVWSKWSKEFRIQIGGSRIGPLQSF